MLKHTDQIANTLGFMVAVDVVEGINPDSIMDKLGDSLTWVEGTGNIDIDYMGELEVIEGMDVTVKDTNPPLFDDSIKDEVDSLNDGNKRKVKES